MKRPADSRSFGAVCYGWRKIAVIYNLGLSAIVAFWCAAVDVEYFDDFVFKFLFWILILFAVLVANVFGIGIGAFMESLIAPGNRRLRWCLLIVVLAICFFLFRYVVDITARLAIPF